MTALYRLLFCLGLIVSFLPVAKATGPVRAVETKNQFSIWIDSESMIDSTVYYSCDGLESTTKDLLKKLGVNNISVRCEGNTGDPETPTYSPILYISFNSARLPTPGVSGSMVLAQWQNVVLRSFNDCESVRQIMNGLADHIEVQHLSSSWSSNSSCFTSDSPYNYNFTTLVPAAK